MFAVNREKKNQGIKFHWCYRWSRKERIYTFLVPAHSNPIKGFSKNGDTIFWRTHWPISSEFCCWSLISSHHKLPWQYTLVRCELLLQYRKPWVKPKVTWIWPNPALQYKPQTFPQLKTFAYKKAYVTILLVWAELEISIWQRNNTRNVINLIYSFILYIF